MVKLQVIVDHRGDEVVAVVIAGMAPQGQRLAGRRASGFEYFGEQLVGQEFVSQALIDQDARAGKAGAARPSARWRHALPGGRVAAPRYAENALSPQGHCVGAQSAPMRTPT